MRSTRLHEARNHDPYRATAKPRNPGHCPTCGVVQLHGRWQWPTLSTMIAGEERTCPACKRIADANPAGLLHIAGPFAQSHRDEIVALCRHEEHKESSRHPLNRIIALENDDGAMLVATTDTHLPERLGHALHRAYKGDIAFHHDAGAALLRVEWRR